MKGFRKSYAPKRVKARAGRLARAAFPDPPARCSRCKGTKRKLHRHHPDYSKPLKIRWLCTLCHCWEDTKRQERETLARFGPPRPALGDMVIPIDQLATPAIVELYESLAVEVGRG